MALHPLKTELLKLHVHSPIQMAGSRLRFLSPDNAIAVPSSNAPGLRQQIHDT
jgi:hypothetical protein